MITGSAPASVAVCTLAIGLSPNDFAFSADMNSSAAEPSEIWLELPAWITPSSLNAGFSSRHLLDGGAAADALVLEHRIAVLVLDGHDLVVECTGILCGRSLLVRLRARTRRAPCGRSPTARRSSRRRCPGWASGCSGHGTPPGTGARRWPARRPSGCATSTRRRRRRRRRSARRPHRRRRSASTAGWTRTAGRPSRPARSPASRPPAPRCGAISSACSPACMTQPQMTSSTIPGSMPARSARPLSTCADSSPGCTPDNPPLRLPTGDRTASTMTASAMNFSFEVVEW